jgi:pseudouridine-5'-phosphate glycosidase
MPHPHIHVHPDVAQALKHGEPVVALESTIVAHGMPYPDNLENAQVLEQLVKEGGATPATIAVAKGQIHIGCDAELMHALASEAEVWKVSRRDLPLALSRGILGATTVSGTLIGAQFAGIPVFATGGIGGVHRGASETWDVSADMAELAKASVAVVSAGAKSILDLPKTLEVLESLGVAVMGYQTDDFPAFFVRRSGLKVPHRCDNPEDVAGAMHAKWTLGLEGGFLIANPIPEADSIDAELVERAISAGLEAASEQGVHGKALTPFLLRFINSATEGRSLAANRKLVESNVRVGTEIACAFAVKNNA